MEFLGDQGRDVVIIRNLLKNGELFFIGPQTSIGNMYLGPFYYYLIAPSLLFSNFNPIGPSILIALFGIATVALIYIITKKWFGLKAALLASFLYAIAPVVIKYSNFSWNPNIMPFFSLLFIYFLSQAFFEKKYINLVFASISFVFAINSHYLALSLLPTAGLYWLYYLIKAIKKDKNDVKPLLKNTLFAALLFIISLTPQILFDIKHHGQISGALIKFFTYRETTVSIKPYKAIPNLAPLFNQVNTRLLAGKNEILGIGISIFMILGITFTFFKNKIKNTKEFKYFLLLVLWYLFGIVSLGLYKQHIYDHYFGFLFPVVFMIAGFLISKLISLNLHYKFLGVLLLLTIAAFSIIENPLRYSPPRQMAVTRQIVDSIHKDSNNLPFNLALLAKQNYDPPYRYFFYEKESPIYDLHDKMTDQLYVICEPWQMECQPINNPLWEIAAFGWSKIEKQWQINDITVFKLVHANNTNKTN